MLVDLFAVTCRSWIAPILVLFGLSCADEPLPDPLSGLSLAVGDARFALSWTAPGTDRAVVLRRGVSGPPSSLDSVDAVTLSTGDKTTVSDACPVHGATVHYAAFVVDSAGRSSPAVRATGRCTFLPFTWVVMPDSQYYADALYRVNVAWILAQQKARRIVALLHEGDITHNNTVAEWQIAAGNLIDLDGKVPLVLSVGNHDMTKGGDTSLFNKHFPLSEARARSGFVGNFPDQKLDNNAYTLTAGGTNWLVVSLRVEPTDAAMAWADTVVARYPTHRVVVLTHAYLGPSGSRTTAGERIWKTFVRRHRTVTFVFCGHYIGGNAARLISTGDHGNKVYQMFANYQMEPLSGNARLRLVRVDPAAGTVSVKSYSPMMERYLSDDANEFSFSGVALGAPKPK